MLINKQETRLKKGHVALMKHPETALYSGVMLMGVSEVIDKKFTAYTDGVNKRYSKPYIEGIKEEPKLRGLILHENLHVALKQLPRGKDMWEESAMLANMSADFVVNDIIHNITGIIPSTKERIVELPDGALYDAQFHNWSMREVFNYLKKHCKGKRKSKGDGDGDGDGSGVGDIEMDEDGEPSVTINGKKYKLKDCDEHDTSGTSELSHEDAKELSDKIDKALREGGMLAGRMGAKIPRHITELLEPKIDWREVLRDFVSSTVKGKDEFTWRKLNKRQLANDLYLPSMENETIGEVVVAIDTSGSIGGKELTEFATELASICELCSPEVVRVLWWDTQVHGEQVFKGNYQDIASLLKPLGGGGTHVGCVSKYINKERINAECVLVFTDGHVEPNIQWNIIPPTLWMITQNHALEVPSGKKVIFNNN